MVTKVIGKVDGKEVVFERAEGDLWNTTVPLDLDGMWLKSQLMTMQKT